MKDVHKNDDGFTLIETIMAITIFTILMLTINMVFLSFYRQQKVDIAMMERTNRAGRILENLGMELREMSRGEDGSFCLMTTQPQELTFFSDVNDDDLNEKVTYRLNGTDLEKLVVAPGDDHSYSSEGDLSVVCDGIQNGTDPIFEYYNENYSGSEDPMEYPIMVLQVKLIGIYLDVNTENSSLPDPFNIETKIQLRNLN